MENCTQKIVRKGVCPPPGQEAKWHVEPARQRRFCHSHETLVASPPPAIPSTCSRMTSSPLLLLCTPARGYQVSGIHCGLMGWAPGGQRKRVSSLFSISVGGELYFLPCLLRWGIPETQEWDSYLGSQKIKLFSPWLYIFEHQLCTRNNLVCIE